MANHGGEMKTIHQILYGAALLFPLLGVAASFDCAKARKPVEKTICADPALSRLDEELAAAYRLALDKSASRGAVKEWQRYWLAWSRDGAGDAASLRQAYCAQLLELGQHARASSAGDAYTGVYRRYRNGRPDEDSAEIVVIVLSGQRVRILGNANWVGNAATGNVNMAMVDGTAVLAGKLVHYVDPAAECGFTLRFGAGGLEVGDEHAECGGMNVTFKGTYRKATDAR